MCGLIVVRSERELKPDLVSGRVELCDVTVEKVLANVRLSVPRKRVGEHAGCKNIRVAIHTNGVATIGGVRTVPRNPVDGDLRVEPLETKN